MKKLLWLLPLAILIACGPTTTELVPPETNVDTNTAVSTTNAETSEEDTDESSAPAATTNLEAFEPASSIDQAAVVREQDWRKGAAEPLIVIIEYGDFQ